MNSYRDDMLMHHGVKGQRWGVRRYRNEDGTLTKAGMKRYDKNRKIVSKTIRVAEAVADQSKDYKEKYQKVADDVRSDGHTKLNQHRQYSRMDPRDKERAVFMAAYRAERVAKANAVQEEALRENIERLRSMDVSDYTRKQTKEAIRKVQSEVREKYGMRLDQILAEYDRESEKKYRSL